MLDQSRVLQVCTEIARIANIPPEKRHEFFTSIDCAIEAWRTEYDLDGRVPQRGRAGKLIDIHGVLLEMRRSADLLLYYLRRAGESYSHGDDWLGLAYKLSPAPHEGTLSIEEMLTSILKIRQAITQAVNFKQIKGYPGLAGLVFRLELAAQAAGGKFTAHKKHGNKGSLLTALDLLRPLILAWLGEVFAERLPKPEDHSVSEYERLLTRAREAMAMARRTKLSITYATYPQSAHLT
jgi:hypothetical protein